jgi:translation initiation factor IF-3
VRLIAQDKDKDTRINEEITAPEIRLIGVDGEQVGIVSLATANKMAEEAGVDLVEIAPTARPPVCRIMDYGKYKYAEAKKRHEAKLKQKQIQVKEVKFRPGTDEGDYQIKVRNLIRFLEGRRDKTKVTLRFPAARWRTRVWRQVARADSTDLDPFRCSGADAEAGRPANDHGVVAQEEAVALTEIPGDPSRGTKQVMSWFSEAPIQSGHPSSCQIGVAAMPKMKTKSGAAKRFRVQGGGGIKRSRAFLRHSHQEEHQA